MMVMVKLFFAGEPLIGCHVIPRKITSFLARRSHGKW